MSRAIADVPDDMWEQFGPSATGIGWDSGLLGLALHLGVAVDGPTPEEGVAWMMSDEGKAFTRASAKEWESAHVADGADPDSRRAGRRRDGRDVPGRGSARHGRGPRAGVIRGAAGIGADRRRRRRDARRVARTAHPGASEAGL